MTDNGQALDVTRIIPIDIEEEMKKSFIEYAMSVIADRALPDVRDGLKPVHRRILFAMSLLGFTPDKSHRKCASTVGEVLAKFHPHGDAAVYDSLVRMAQDFSLRHPLVDGHGNFGSRDGDSPAAMRYTEARLARISTEMLQDINKDTVDFKPNFDNHEMEPVVLPSRFPNLLVNGSAGIAVGMATNIPPHNLCEVIDGISACLDHPDITADELNDIIKGPDFPTYGTIVGKSGIRQAYRTGRGRVVVRARAEIEEGAGHRQRIIVKDLPYQVNKARLIEKIAELVKEKKIDGISDINDESDRNDPVRIVITLKREANAGVTLNKLYSHTQLQDAFNVNMLALVPAKDGCGYEPRVLTLKTAIQHYITHQEDVIRRRTRFELDKAAARAHILEGLIKAVDILDWIIETIRKSENEPAAKANLMESFDFTDRQAQAIVDMRLGRLTGLEILKLQTEFEELKEKIGEYEGILKDLRKVHGIIREELELIRRKFGDQRRTVIEAEELEMEDEDLIEEKTVVITLTHFGYIKRLPVDTYRAQRRGGRGITGLSTREEDFAVNLFTTSTHATLLFFTSHGKVYKLKGYQVPEVGRTAKGTAIVNLLPLESGEKVTAVIPISERASDLCIFMATKKGFVKKTCLSEFDNIRKSGIIAVSLRDDDELICARLTNGDKQIMLVTRDGMSIKFHEEDVRPMGRGAQGVMGIRITEDQVVSMEVAEDQQTLLSVTQRGFGKRTATDEYTLQKRGGKGILTYRVTEKTGPVVGSEMVVNDDDIMLISAEGVIIRMAAREISILGRATQGVTLMRTGEETQVASLAKIAQED